MLIASWSFLFQRICGGMMTCHFCSNRIRGAVVLPSLASHPWLAAWPTTLIQRKSWTGACLSARTGLDSLGGCPCPSSFDDDEVFGLLSSSDLNQLTKNVWQFLTHIRIFYLPIFLTYIRALYMTFSWHSFRHIFRPSTSHLSDICYGISLTYILTFDQAFYLT